MVTHLYKTPSKEPHIERSERDDLVAFTAEKLQAQSDELLSEFMTIVQNEQHEVEDMAVKSFRLMQIFE